MVLTSELREDHGRQPCGYTQVRWVCLVLGVLVCNF